MTKQSQLSGVAHNIAHHTASGLSYVSPYLANSLRAAGIDSTQFELLVEQPYPPNTLEITPLKLALKTLRLTVIGLLKKHGFDLNKISSIILHATPAPWDKQGYILHTRAVITTRNGRVFDSGWIQ